MTKQEFLDKYGDVKVKFIDYIKFTFIYSVVMPSGDYLTVSVCGDQESAYEHEVNAVFEVPVRKLDPYMGSVYQHPSRIEIETFNECGLEGVHEGVSDEVSEEQVQASG